MHIKVLQGGLFTLMEVAIFLMALKLLLGPLLCLNVLIFYFQFAGARSGKVYPVEEHPWSLGSDSVTNNTGEVEALGHALAWLSTLQGLDGDVLLVADSTYALAAMPGTTTLLC